jgi:hypothetical protein
MTQIITTFGTSIQVKPSTNLIFTNYSIEYLTLNGCIEKIDISQVKRIEIS